VDKKGLDLWELTGQLSMGFMEMANWPGAVAEKPLHFSTGVHNLDNHQRASKFKVDRILGNTRI